MKYLCVRVLCMLWSCLASLLFGMEQQPRQRYRPRFMGTSVPVRQLTMDDNIAAFLRASQQQAATFPQQHDELMPQAPVLQSESAERGDPESASSADSVASAPVKGAKIDLAAIQAVRWSGGHYCFDSREVFRPPTPTELQTTPVFRHIKKVRVWRSYPQADLVAALKREFGRRYVGDGSDSDESDNRNSVVC